MGRPVDAEEFLNFLYTKHHDFLVGWCRKSCEDYPELREMAEDFVQEAFFKAAKQSKKIINHPKPLAWLVITCENIILNNKKHMVVKEKRFAVHYELRDDSPIEDKENRVERWEKRYDDIHTLEEILDTLTNEERSVYDDHFVEEMTIDEVAAKHGKPRTAIVDTINRIHKKARATQRKKF